MTMTWPAYAAAVLLSRRLADRVDRDLGETIVRRLNATLRDVPPPAHEKGSLLACSISRCVPQRVEMIRPRLHHLPSLR